MLEHAIQHNAFRLRKQSVAELADLSNVVQQEVFASLEYDDKLYHAGYFIGLAEQFDLGVQVDQVIIGLTIEHLAKLSTDRFVDNLSPPLEAVFYSIKHVFLRIFYFD